MSIYIYVEIGQGLIHDRALNCSVMNRFITTRSIKRINTSVVSALVHVSRTLYLVWASCFKKKTVFKDQCSK